MRKKIMAFVFAAALLMALAVPLFGGGGTALAAGPPSFIGDPPVDAPINTMPTDCSLALAVAGEHATNLGAAVCP